MKCGPSELEEEIVQDVKDLSEIFGRKVTGFAYPYGVSSEASAEYLKKSRREIRKSREVG